MQPAVSVIIPVYGVEAYIERCARSLFGQTSPDAEFIFIDDGSKDRSVDILKGVLADYPSLASRVTVISKNNEGQSYARRDGIAMAKGDYVMFVDSDDWIDPDTVEKLVGCARETDADIVVYDFWKEYGSRRKIDSERDCNIADRNRYRKNLYTYRAYGYICNKLCRRSLCEDLFFPRHSMHEDLIFSTQIIYRARKIVHLKEALYHYDCSNSSSSSRAPRKVRRSRSARNMMDFYHAFEGQPDSPVSGIDDELILRAAWVGITMDRTIFADYPDLAPLALSYKVKGGRFVSVPAQILMKILLKKYCR